MSRKKKNKDNVTTKRHFKIFKKEFMKWRRRFGLLGIEINFEHRKSPEGGLAWTSYSSRGQVSCIGLGKDWSNFPLSDREVRKAAFHECMELFLYPIRDCAEERFVTQKDIDEEMHRAIRTLEEVLFEGEKSRTGRS